MGFFKSIKKKLSLFKRQVQKILPRELTDNPEIVAAFIIGGSIPFGQTQQSLFARGASSVGNLFWYTNNTWFTPDLNYAGVQGVMRNQVLSILKDNKMKCQQVQADFDALANAEEVMVCNSLMAIVPVMSLFNPITGKTFRYKVQQSKRLQTMLQRLTSSKATKV